MDKGLYDVVIIGGGPAGLTAGMYASRARLKTVLLESVSVAGQLVTADTIENYPGIENISGFELVSKMKQQAVSFGLECAGQTAVKISRVKRPEGNAWKVEHDSGAVETLSVIIASGACPKKLGVPGEEEFIGKGVSYCATCDAAFFREKEIVVVGGGNTAVEEALFLTAFGKKVTIVHRRGRFRAEKIVQERASANEKIGFVWDNVVEEIRGNDKVEKVALKNVKTGEKKDLPCDGVFIFAGWSANTGFAAGMVDLTKKGAVVIDREMKTSQEGIFACGDCCKRPLHQVVTACGDGAVAAQSARLYVDDLKGTSYK